jgi:hypothetical protein
VRKKFSNFRSYGPSRGRDAVCIAFLLLFNLLCWIPNSSGPLDLRWDAGVYYTLGTSLAQGKGYRLLYEPGEIEALQYPPLLPLIIAAHSRILRTTEPVQVGASLRVTWLLLSMLLTFLIYRLAREFLSPFLACAVVLAWTLNVDRHFLAGLGFAELPFTTAATGFLYWSRQDKPMGQFLAGTSALACYLLRSIGITVLLIWIVDGFLRRRKRQALLRVGLSAVIVSGWMGWVLRVEHSGAYQHPTYAYQRAPYLFYNVSYTRNVAYRDPFHPELGQATAGDRIKQAASYVVRFPRAIGFAMFTQRGLWEGVFDIERLLWRGSLQIVAAASGMLVAFGLVVLWRRGEWHLPALVVLTLTAVAANPWPGQEWRYLNPLAPMFLIALFTTVTLIQMRLPSTRVAVAGITVLLLCAVAALFVGVSKTMNQTVSSDFRGHRASWQTIYYDAGWRQLDYALSWLKTHGRTSDLVVSSMPAWVYLHTGNQSVMPPFEQDTELKRRLLAATGARFVIAETMQGASLTEEYLSSVLVNPEWRICFGSPQSPVRVYEHVSESISQPAEAR